MIRNAFIFARGGSKGLPRKNVLPLAGKPLLAHSIDSAKQAGIFTRIFVSTDDAEIANVARQYGAEVIDRPAQLAQDTSSEWLAWQHAITWVQSKYGAFETFVSLPTTSPLRIKDDIIAAVEQLNATDADICISITPASRSPYFNMVTRQDSGEVQLVINTDTKVLRRQDAPEVFDITTVVYAAKSRYVESGKGVLSGKVTSICVPPERAVDIDTQLDFDLAQLLIARQESN
ncbi:cytidylyltransferase domain-containing protein [Pseudoalteromonas sp. SSDWG2]|uniref:acylneuraminate cytidylyltransferase family protein n=1 Tax=Pseudoalteromonas sp. SSDWG2 TaxID=3139391 RepID=UPI003BA92FD2